MRYLTRKTISIIPIAYKDEGNIRELYERVTDVMREITPNYEIIYVNDASPDRSQEILEELAAKDKRLTVILHSRNFGAQNAFTTGMKQAIGDAVILMDGDLQDPPSLFPKLVRKWLQGYQVVYGNRRKREKSMGKIAEFIYHYFYVIFNQLSYVKIPLDAGEFSLIDKEIVEHLNSLPEKDRFIRGLRAWVGFKQIGVSYTRPERYSGKGVSTTSFWKGLAWARKAIFSFSYAPLEFVFIIASSSVIVLLAAIIFYIAAYFLLPTSPSGFMTILLAILFIGSVQLVTLSIICEYLKRIIEEVKGRPVSIVQKLINNHKNSRRTHK